MPPSMRIFSTDARCLHCVQAVEIAFVVIYVVTGCLLQPFIAARMAIQSSTGGNLRNMEPLYGTIESWSPWILISGAGRGGAHWPLG